VNEGWRLQLQRGGKKWPIQQLVADGIVLDGETDTFPRGAHG
jgi:hypothetical protein